MVNELSHSGHSSKLKLKNRKTNGYITLQQNNNNIDIRYTNIENEKINLFTNGPDISCLIKKPHILNFK
jgi:hypothetical protein